MLIDAHKKQSLTIAHVAHYCPNSFHNSMWTEKQGTQTT